MIYNNVELHNIEGVLEIAGPVGPQRAPEALQLKLDIDAQKPARECVPKEYKGC